MITVQYSAAGNDVGLIVDQKGAKHLIELLTELSNNGVRDHIHLSSGPATIDGKPQHPDFHALSLVRQTPNPDFSVAEGLTVVFRA